MYRIIRIESNIFEDFKAELMVEENTTREQLKKAHELLDKYVESAIEEREETGNYDEEIDYEELFKDALTDAGITYHYVPTEVWDI